MEKCLIKMYVQSPEEMGFPRPFASMMYLFYVRGAREEEEGGREEEEFFDHCKNDLKRHANTLSHDAGADLG